MSCPGRCNRERILYALYARRRARYETCFLAKSGVGDRGVGIDCGQSCKWYVHIYRVLSAMERSMHVDKLNVSVRLFVYPYQGLGARSKLDWFRLGFRERLGLDMALAFRVSRFS